MSWVGRCSTASPTFRSAGGIRQAIAIFSYVGRLTFGVTADADNVPDIEVLAHGIEEGLAELLKAAREVGGTARAARGDDRSGRAQAPSRIEATSTRKIRTVPQNSPKHPKNWYREVSPVRIGPAGRSSTAPTRASRRHPGTPPRPG